MSKKVLKRKVMKGLRVLEKCNHNKRQMYELPVSFWSQLGMAQVIFMDSGSTNFSKRGQTAPPADRIRYRQHLNDVSVHFK